MCIIMVFHKYVDMNQSYESKILALFEKPKCSPKMKMAAWSVEDGAEPRDESKSGIYAIDQFLSE